MEGHLKLTRASATADERRAHAQRLESIGGLASGVAHELNNPLGVVMSLAQLIVDDRDSTAQSQGFAAIIMAETERMAVMVRNLLSYSRKDVETSRPAGLGELVEQTLSLMRSMFRKDRIEVITDIPDVLPPVPCRSQQIQQVLMNLLTNARDAVNARPSDTSSGKRIRISAEALEREDVRWVRLVVEDNGVGVPKTVSHRIFDPFFTTKPPNRGTGLGLSISDEIIKAHGGDIRFDPPPGGGARFVLDLKATWSDAPPSPRG